MSFLKLIRFPNLLIVVLTQYLLQYLILIPALDSAEINPLLDHFHFFLLVLATVLIAAGGFVINDLEDYEIDIVNKPEKVYINKIISAKNAKKLYWGISIFGLMISLYLAFYVDNLPLVLIYPIAVLLLFLYSKSLKKSVLWGNMVVALFCAFVAGIVIFAEQDNVWLLYHKHADTGSKVLETFIFYLLFAFCSTMFREIVKDIEDKEGDEKNGARTLPIVAGINVAKGFAYAFGLMLLLLLGAWMELDKTRDFDWSTIYLMIGIGLPMAFAMFKLFKAKQKKEFHFISQLAKYIMLSGILYLLILSFY